MTETGGSTVTAGWYADPSGQGQVRWWDGGAWTAQTRPSWEVAPAPSPIATSAPVQWARNTPAFAALTCGGLSLLFNPLFLASIAAIVLGVIGLRRGSDFRAEGHPAPESSRAAWGIALGCVGLLTGFWLMSRLLG